eukprot:CAMPEP_0197844542 /NCGR_PEP_ID=MMETSP1438-20131217/1523_1 /TAXON_ID=1461541 /ORGANISM="Pterosperma sp., Strain CCMP1384" /LENGTH=57 /DNA_ID=CAMNT_0043455375 /DNA_START=703 /DNA_END=876 /DNA_ORIENTATION=+
MRKEADVVGREEKMWIPFPRGEVLGSGKFAEMLESGDQGGLNGVTGQDDGELSFQET